MSEEKQTYLKKMDLMLFKGRVATLAKISDFIF